MERKNKKNCKQCPMVKIVNEYKDLVSSYYDLVNGLLPIIMDCDEPIPRYIVLTVEDKKRMERRCKK